MTQFIHGCAFAHLQPLRLPFASAVIAIAASLGALSSSSSFATTYTVSSITDLKAKIDIAVAGDQIIVTSGTYTTSSEISVDNAGTDAQPILIAAQSPGAVTINGSAGFHLKSPAAHVIIQGFNFRHSGTLVMDLGTHHCRISRNDFQVGGSNYLWVQGDDQEIEYNKFHDKTNDGQMVKVDLSGRGHSGTERTYLHHNYFLNHSGAGEAITTWGPFTTMEYNLFVECNGDPEVISMKASDGVYRFNTLRNCDGGMVFRFANRCTAAGNFMINCNPGMRVYGADHQIYNNYIESCGTGIIVGDGHSDGTYLQCDGVQIVFNTLVNNGKGVGPNGSDQRPINMTFANNIIQQSSGTFFDWSSSWSNSTLNGNIMWGGASRGDMPTSGYRSVDPLLSRDSDSIYHIGSSSPAINTAVGSYSFVSEDMDGQSRGTADVGADESSSASGRRSVLASADVGVDGPYFFEAESLDVAASSISVTAQPDGSSSEHSFDQLNATTVGDFVKYILPNVAAGTYDVRVGLKKNNNRGIFQTLIGKVGGSLGNLGAPFDEYASSISYPELDLGTWTPGSNSDKNLQFQVTGKNGSSSGYVITIDYIKLVPQ